MVVVKVVSISSDMVQDEFELSKPNHLANTLRTLNVTAREVGCGLQFTGIDEEWWPFGIRRTRRTVGTMSQSDALRFLAS
jgi:hypothetical protein